MGGGGSTYDYGFRIYNPSIAKFLSVDPLATERSWMSPYNFVQNNPINRIDPTGALDNPIYDKQGDFLGTDERGIQGEGIVMDKKDFKQGMSHQDALAKGTMYSQLPKLQRPEMRKKIESHSAGLSSRPDYDGFVTIQEGIDWAKQRPNTLGNNDPNDALYLDASKLNFGNLSVSDMRHLGFTDGVTGPINLFDYVGWSSSSSRASTYALGNTQIQLVESQSGTVRLFSDIYDWDFHGEVPQPTIHQRGHLPPLPKSTRDKLIFFERGRAGINDSHGFRIFIYGTGTIKTN